MMAGLLDGFLLLLLMVPQCCALAVFQIGEDGDTPSSHALLFGLCESVLE